MPTVASAAREVPEVPEAPRSPSPQLAAALSGPSPGWQGREATTNRYWGPELYNYHGRLSYFGKWLCCSQSFYSSKPKQDGKSPAQDAASGRRREVNPLPPRCPHPGAACTQHCPRVKAGPGGFGCTGGGFQRWGSGIWGWRGQRVAARHGMLGGQPHPRLLGGSEATCWDAFLPLP